MMESSLLVITSSSAIFVSPSWHFESTSGGIFRISGRGTPQSEFQMTEYQLQLNIWTDLHEYVVLKFWRIWDGYEIMLELSYFGCCHQLSCPGTMFAVCWALVKDVHGMVKLNNGHKPIPSHATAPRKPRTATITEANSVKDRARSGGKKCRYVFPSLSTLFPFT